MDYKNKYNNALEKLQEALAPKDGREISGLTRGCIEEIFPELKESEDERIRKELIRYFNGMNFVTQEGAEKATRWIAWLEKQKAIDVLDAEEREFADDVNSYRKDMDEFYKKGYDAGREAERQTWLEKQGNKPQGESESERIRKAIKVIKEEEKNDYENKVEPKFHKGEWVTNNIETIQIIGYDIDYGYQVDYNGKLLHRDTDIIEKDYHFWTINDVKDGDILQLGKVTAIFQKYIGNGHCKCYCSVYNGEFEIQSQDVDDNSYGCDDGIPATKEQRDKLLKAMTDAGWQFDFEKKELKELKKVEQNPAWNEEDDYNVQCLVAKVTSDIQNGNVGRNQELIDWLKSLKQRIEE